MREKNSGVRSWRGGLGTGAQELESSQVDNAQVSSAWVVRVAL